MDEAFERLINAFYDRVEEDELPRRRAVGGKVSADTADHAHACGPRPAAAPPATTDELGGYDRCLPEHRGSRITPEQRPGFAR